MDINHIQLTIASQHTKKPLSKTVAYTLYKSIPLETYPALYREIRIL